jgi:hypothetical protein
VPAIANSANPDNQQKFELRCQSIALIWWDAAMEFDEPPPALYLEAVDECARLAAEIGLTDPDQIALIIARAFAPYREDLAGWLP